MSLQTTTNDKTPPRAGSTLASTRRGPAAPGNTNPLPIVTVSKHPVYGATPIGRDGFTLERQSLMMLDFWHERASKLIKAGKLPASGLLRDQQALFRTAIYKDPRSCNELAYKLSIIARHIKSNGGQLEGVLRAKDLTLLAFQAFAAAAPIAPQRTPGPLQRGKKLTRAGLLHRYQAFLMWELETVSFDLYGEPRFAKQYRFEDYAVSQRCHRNRRKYPLLDAGPKLVTRARSVLGSLNIDTKQGEEAVRNSRGGGAR